MAADFDDVQPYDAAVLFDDGGLPDLGPPEVPTFVAPNVYQSLTSVPQGPPTVYKPVEYLVPARGEFR